MPVSSTPVFPQTPVIGTCQLTAVAACTTRAPTPTASLPGANIFALTPVSTNGKKVDAIQVNAAASAIGGATTAGLVQIWLWDGTNATLLDEIPVTAITPSATAAAFSVTRYYDRLILPSTYRLYASTTVATTAAANALVVTALGGDL